MFHHIDDEVDVSSLAQQGEVAEIIRVIKHHEQELVTLRKRLNPFLRASRIPDDILVEVFRHSVRAAHESYWERKSNRELLWIREEECPEELRWWSVPLVCQRWRNLVMSNPGLWSTITSYDRPEYGLSAIKHSMSAGLRLFLATPFQEDSLFCSLLEQLPRTYSLEYCFSRWGRRVADQMLPPGTFDKLRTLYFRCSTGHDIEGSLREDILTRSLGEAPLPRLATLILERVSTSTYSMFVRPTITSLEIVNGHNEYGVSELEVASLLTILSSLPLLKILRLKFPSLSGPGQDTYRPNLADAHLPHLQEFNLCTHNDACLSLLSHLSFHPNTNVSVSLAGTWSPTSPSRSSDFSQSSDRSQSPDPSALPSKVTIEDTDLVGQIMERLKSLQLDHWVPPCRLLLADDIEGEEFRIQIFSPSGHSLTIRSPDAHIDTIIGHFPLQQIEEVEFRGSAARVLEVSGSIENRSRHWGRAIGASSIIFRSTAEAFTYSLSLFMAPGVRDERFGPDVPLPRLESLAAFDVEGETGSNYPPHHFANTLRTMLKGRQEAGVPIKKFSWHQDMDRDPMFHSYQLGMIQAHLEEMGVESDLNIPVRFEAIGRAIAV